MRAFAGQFVAVLVLWAASLFVVGCSDMGVGRKCIIPTPDAGVLGTQISSPALECPTRLCLIQGDTSGMVTRATCTAKCETDGDCASAVLQDPNKPDPQLCKSGFKCAVATTAGSLKCQKLCVCKEDLVCGVNGDADGGGITPMNCPNPTQPTPSCTM
jgi:hypothetical protein